MSNRQIRKAAVIGGGVMGSGIAAHFANARIPVVLFDISQEYAEGAVAKMKKQKPAPLFTKRDLDLITPANINDTDHLQLLGDVDIVVEDVPEVLKIKQDTFGKSEEYLQDNTKHT